MELQTENGKKKVPLSTGLKWLRLVCMAVVFGIIAGGVMVGMNYLGGSMAAEEESIPQTSTVKVTAKAEDSDAVVAVAREAMPSVVTISTMSVEEMRSFFGGTQEIQVQGAGTGVIVNKNESELLIGINEAKTSSSGSGGSVDNIGFAIPIDKAEDSLKELMNLPTREKVDPSEASYLGIEGETITQDITQLYGIPTGVGVVAVEPGSAAEKAGIQQGDVITQFDGRAVANQQQLSDTLQYYKAGETVDVTLQRADNGQYAGQTVSVTLGSAKDMPQESGASSAAESSDT